jgi:hypothetical protein
MMGDIVTKEWRDQIHQLEVDHERRLTDAEQRGEAHERRLTEVERHQQVQATLLAEALERLARLERRVSALELQADRRQDREEGESRTAHEPPGRERRRTPVGTPPRT